MPFQVSPGVNVSEIDLTTIVPAVSTTEGAIAGVFRWGPIGQAILVDSEDKLAARFGKPDSTNPETFFTAANFLAYGNKLYVSRAANTTDTTGVTGVLTAVANTGAYANTILIKNSDNYDLLTNPDADVLYAAKYPGALGNSLKVSVCDSVNAYGSNLNMFLSNSSLVLDSTKISNAGIVFTVGSNQATIFIGNTAGHWGNTDSSAAVQGALDIVISNTFIVGSILQAGNATIGTQGLRITSIANAVYAAGNTTAAVNLDANYTLSTNYYSNTAVSNWEYYNAVDKAPGTSVYTKKFGNSSAVDEVHVIVADEDGKVTGVPGTILETFRGLSRATDAKTEDGATLYYKEVLNQNSNWIWWINHRSGAIGNTAVNIVNSTNSKPVTLSFVTGSDGATEANVAIGDLTRGYDLFKSAEDIDVSLILQGKSRGASNTAQLANYLINNIAESRKDCVVFISPDKDDVVNNVGKTEVTDVVGFRNALTSTSYAVMDSGYKYQYDKYNDVYRYIP